MPTARRLLHHPLIVAAVLTALAFATRAWLFGNPLIHSDEQYYVLVGSRILDGALPYVDIWDRKPVGLFLLYAALLAPGWNGILAYQVAATLAAAATAFLVSRLTARAAPAPEALAAGVLYLLWRRPTLFAARLPNIANGSRSVSIRRKKSPASSPRTQTSSSFAHRATPTIRLLTH